MSAPNRSGSARTASALPVPEGALAPDLRLAETLVLPKEVVTAKIAVLANSGAGKSYCGMKLAELMLGIGAQIVALDPVGIWYGLLSAADGKGPGFRVLILGGAHGHLALSPRAGAAVAAFLVKTGVSAVVDLSDMLPDALREFVTDFSRALLLERRKQPAAMHLFLEEADNFSPQRMKGQASYDMVLAVAKLLKEGRHAGIGWTLITQRAQDVDKVALDLVETLFALRTGKSWRRVREWLVEKEVQVKAGLQEELAQMETGGAIVVSPHLLNTSYLRIHILPRVTFDSSRTPELGAAPIAPQLAEVDLAEIRAAMAETLERIEEGDPKALARRLDEQSREIERLRTALAAQPAATRPREIEQLRREVDQMCAQLQPLVDALLCATQKARSDAEALRDGALELQRKLGDVLTRVLGPALNEEHLGSTLDALLEQDGTREEVAKEAKRRVAAYEEQQRPQQAGALSGCATGILWVFAWAGASTIGLERTTLAIRSGYSPLSSSFGSALTELRAAGLVEAGASRGTYRLLPAGEARLAELGELPEAPGPSTLAEVRQAWLEKPSLSRSAKTILEVLLREDGPLTRQQLSERTGYSTTSSSFHSAIGELATLGLLDRRGRGDGATLSAARVLVGAP